MDAIFFALYWYLARYILIFAGSVVPNWLAATEVRIGLVGGGLLFLEAKRTLHKST